MRFIDRVRVQWRKGSREEFWHHHSQNTLLFTLSSDFGKEQEGKTGVSATLSLSSTWAYEWTLLSEKPECGIFISSDGPKLKCRVQKKKSNEIGRKKYQGSRTNSCRGAWIFSCRRWGDTEEFKQEIDVIWFVLKSHRIWMDYREVELQGVKIYILVWLKINALE